MHLRQTYASAAVPWAARHKHLFLNHFLKPLEGDPLRALRTIAVRAPHCDTRASLNHIARQESA
jgi:hypothetical protein